MGRKTSALIQEKLQLRRNALVANSADLPHMDVPRQNVEAVLAEMKDLTSQQASLTAAKQDVSKRLLELNTDGKRLMTLVNAAVRQKYGNRSEKLVEFDQQPFRSKPRVRLVGPDGKPVKPSHIPVVPPAPSAPSHE
ncbi:MAG TPA: hypothetical protein VH988_35450 [Thermoanaerobaculia bacterium]|jgi:hypothetical protein|nr:hypothetical protein [Thermoanaerobaculia bacterium]